jgi:cobalt-precorrin-5B (C1)-methyltransferase
MKKLRSGYTTGACAAAAAKAAALLLRDSLAGQQVKITLPNGDTACFTLHSSTKSSGSATCSVIKDAGDDPDITNQAEIIATVTTLNNSQKPELLILGGAGIGRVTKPGLAVPVGEWAINPVPRRMIAQAVQEVFPDSGISVTISIPDGEERAKKTLNARLGIVGGLSILGTTGIVKPISTKAWTDTIDTSIDVAKACNCPTVVLCTGRTSEMAAMQHFKELQEESYLMMGDHVQHALIACVQRGFLKPVLACQFAKLVKIACGHPNTHAASAEMDLASLLKWGLDAGLDQQTIKLIKTANTARELILASRYDQDLMKLVCNRAREAVRTHAQDLEPAILICGYAGETFLF